MAKLPTLRTDLTTGTPVTRQIADQLRVLLVDGALPPGTTLPSVRRVAVDLGVHFNTVAEAYRQLAGEGWLDSKRGRAAVVVERATPVPARRQVTDFRRRLRQLVSQMRAAGMPNEKIVDELLAQVEGRSK